MNLREIRQRQGLTMKQVAIKANVSEAAISLYERGLREPGLTVANRIAAALGVTIDELIGDEPPLTGSAGNIIGGEITRNEQCHHDGDLR